MPPLTSPIPVRSRMIFVSCFAREALERGRDFDRRRHALASGPAAFATFRTATAPRRLAAQQPAMAAVVLDDAIEEGRRLLVYDGLSVGHVHAASRMPGAPENGPGPSSCGGRD